MEQIITPRGTELDHAQRTADTLVATKHRGSVATKHRGLVATKHNGVLHTYTYTHQPLQQRHQPMSLYCLDHTSNPPALTRPASHTPHSTHAPLVHRAAPAPLASLRPLLYTTHRVLPRNSLQILSLDCKCDHVCLCGDRKRCHRPFHNGIKIVHERQLVQVHAPPAKG